MKNSPKLMLCGLSGAFEISAYATPLGDLEDELSFDALAINWSSIS